MKLGCCGTLDQGAEIKASGFAFLEVNIQSVLKGELTDEDWEKQRPETTQFLLPIPAANCLIPANMPIVGPARDLTKLNTYLQRIAHRAKVLGIHTLVFGSGGARKCPPDIGLAAAMDQIAEFAHMAGEACRPHGVTIVVEHLNQKETNTINKLAQARELVQRVNHPNLKALVDSYHYGLEKETDLSLLGLEGMLAHVHVAEPLDRVQPGGHGSDAQKAFDFVHFFRLLRRIGFDGNISFEGKWTAPISQAGPACVAYLHDCWEKAAR